MSIFQGKNKTTKRHNITTILFLLALLIPVFSHAATINTSSSSLILNEFLVNGNVGDANGDGTINATDDAFVEIVNITGSPIDISGYTLWDSDFATARHTFPVGTILGSFEPILVFGGGTTTGFSGIQAQVAINDDLGINFGLHLDDLSDQIRLEDVTNNIVFDISYDSLVDAIAAQSLTLSPDLVGTFVGHTSAAGSIGTPFSPGTLVNGSPIVAPVPVPAAVWLFGSSLGLLGWMRRKAT